jgi:hypothetical protein
MTGFDPRAKMRAARVTRFGLAEVRVVEEMPVPAPPAAVAKNATVKTGLLITVHRSIGSLAD